VWWVLVLPLQLVEEENTMRTMLITLTTAACFLVGCGGTPTPAPDVMGTQVAQAVAAALTAAAPTPMPESDVAGAQVVQA
jgi:AMMECR1 domain-containing protein